MNQPEITCPRCGMTNPRAATNCVRCRGVLSPTGYSRYSVVSAPAPATASVGRPLDVERIRRQQKTRRFLIRAIPALLLLLAVLLSISLMDRHNYDDVPVKSPFLPTSPPSSTPSPNLPGTQTAQARARATEIALPTQTAQAQATATANSLLAPTLTAEASLTRSLTVTTTKGVLRGILYSSEAREQIAMLEADQAAFKGPLTIANDYVAVEQPGTVMSGLPKRSQRPVQSGSIAFAVVTDQPGALDVDSLVLLRAVPSNPSGYYVIGSVTENSQLLALLDRSDQVLALKVTLADGSQPLVPLYTPAPTTPITGTPSVDSSASPTHQITINTNKGAIIGELYANAAPVSVANLIGNSSQLAGSIKKNVNIDFAPVGHIGKYSSLERNFLPCKVGSLMLDTAGGEVNSTTLFWSKRDDLSICNGYLIVGQLTSNASLVDRLADGDQITSVDVTAVSR